MNRSSPWLVTAALCALAAAPGSPRAARADIGPLALADSTVFESWQLSNGLRVVTRHVPGCRHVDVTVAYGLGRADDPPGKEGLATLLAQLEFFGATSEAPERTREQMPDLRPAGWDLVVSPRVTQLSELAPAALFPGVLHQAADRMRGVTVTPAALRLAFATVRADLDTTYRLGVDRALHYGAREWAAGADESQIARRAAARGLQSVGIREVQQRMHSGFVPANAVLSIAGNLGRVPLRALIQNEFGSIPAGEPVRRAGSPPLDSAMRAVPCPQASQSVGVVGVIAPALEDSLHPAFYMQLVLVGAHCQKRWGPAEPPLTSRFTYSIFDDPELARFYPPVAPGEANPSMLGQELAGTVNEMNALMIPPGSYEAVWRGLDWILGGPLPPDIFRRVLAEAGALHTLCAGMARRELWGGEPFWSQYRKRFQAAIANPFPGRYSWLTAAEHLVQVLFVPKR